MLQFNFTKEVKGGLVYLIDTVSSLKEYLSKEQFLLVQHQVKKNITIIPIPEGETFVYIIYLPKDAHGEFVYKEKIRVTGAQAAQLIHSHQLKEITLSDLSESKQLSYPFAEGLAMASYQFLKYKENAKKLSHSLSTIYFTKQSIAASELKKLAIIIRAIFEARNLVNEPVKYLTAEQLSQEFTRIGEEGGFKVSVLRQAKLEQLGMGGLLSVNSGSVLPPTFSVMEYRPTKFTNKAPIVLIGKGIVYDTGGLSLKPTLNSMDSMKSDMSGGALVAAVMYAIAQLELPLHIIGLVPAAENRPGVNAMVPGDVIKLYGGKTVEVMNTDAEGRLILADALEYAKKYRPSLVMNFATLTGAVANLLGGNGIAVMGNADDDTKAKVVKSGWEQYERLVELPLWEEFDDVLFSEIADMRNIGGREGAAITAGKFLERFVEYPWLHFDIAGVSFFDKRKKYHPAGGTGYGIRMMVDFLMSLSDNK